KLPHTTLLTAQDIRTKGARSFSLRPISHLGTLFTVGSTRERERGLGVGVERSNGARKRSGAVNQATTPSVVPLVGVWRIQNAPLDGGAHAALVDELKLRFSQLRRS